MNLNSKSIIDKKKLIILLLIISISIFYYNLSNRNVEENIYSIGNKEKIVKTVDAKALAIFDEYTINNFDDIDLTIDTNKLYSRDQFVEGTNIFKANGRNNYIFNSNKSDSDNFNKLVKNLLKNNINNLTYNNDNIDNNIRKITQINQYNNDKIIKAIDSGYYLNRLDGYETLFSYNSLKNIDWNFLKNPISDKSELVGLKYVNNKEYKLITLISDTNISKDKIEYDFVKINDKNYKVHLSEYTKINNDILLIFTLQDGIEDILNNRLVDIKININFGEGYKIPKNSIIKMNSIKGVNIWVNGYINFIPIDILLNEEEFVYISESLPKYIDSADFNTISPFTKIIKNNNNNYNIGTRYQ